MLSDVSMLYIFVWMSRLCALDSHPVRALRANVGIYRESQISSEKSNFGLYHPNNPLVWLFQKMILKNPQALCIWIILEKFENSQKNAIFIHEISHNFERFQRHSTGAKDLLLTSSSSHV